MILQCIVLQCLAVVVYCSASQCAAVYCSVMQQKKIPLSVICMSERISFSRLCSVLPNFTYKAAASGRASSRANLFCCKCIKKIEWIFQTLPSLKYLYRTDMLNVCKFHYFAQCCLISQTKQRPAA